MCRGADAGGSAELCNMQSPICNVSEYVEELQRCIGDVLEKCGVQYAGSYSDSALNMSIELQTTTSLCSVSTSALLDSGATGVFVN